jgi:uncharacterized phage infection (PIP) family protein YhgE
MGGAPKKALRIPVAVVDRDMSTVSKDIVASMKGDEAFELQEVDESVAIARVREGKVRAALVIPAGSGRRGGAASSARARPSPR